MITKQSLLFIVVMFVWFITGFFLIVYYGDLGFYVSFLFGIVLLGLWGLFAGVNSLMKGISVNIGDRHPISLDSLGKTSDKIRQKLGGKWSILINDGEKVEVRYEPEENKKNYYIRIPIYVNKKGKEKMEGYVELRMSFSGFDLFYSVNIPKAKLIFSRPNFEISEDIYRGIIKNLEE